MCDDPATERDDNDPDFDFDTSDLPDPFALFDEWASPADTEAYALLTLNYVTSQRAPRVSDCRS